MPRETITPLGDCPDLDAGFDVPQDGTIVTNDDLFSSATANRGVIHRLLTAAAWIRKTVGYVALISTDGAGNAAVVWQTKDDNANDWIIGVASSTTGITITLTDPIVGGVDQWATEAHRQRTDAAAVGTRRFEETIKDDGGLSFQVRLVSDGGADLDCDANAVKVFVRMTKAPA